MKYFLALVVMIVGISFGVACSSSNEGPELIVLPTTAAPADPAVVPLQATAEPAVGGGAALSRSTPTSLPPTPVTQPTRPVYAGLPTPDPPHVTEAEMNILTHIVGPGETLAVIAGRYGTTVAELVNANQLADIDYLLVGQVLSIPAAASLVGLETKIIPDSELVYGPTTADFDIREYLSTYYPQSALFTVREVVEEQELDGVGMIDLVALRFSVNPRLLLAMVEQRTGWVTRPFSGDPLPYPMGYVRPGFEGFYTQLSWAANRVNEGFYARAEGGWSGFPLADGTRLAFHPTINHGTAGVQNWLGAHTGATYAGWLIEAGAGGFLATYERLFGSPFARTYEPLLPNGLTQPEMDLPWEPGVPWYFTGGPHGGWASGSSWAALDFGPDRDKLGCYVSEAWVTAALDGTVLYSDFGGVLVDQDGDGQLGTGWVIVYWHVDRQGRVPAGTVVERGDRLGHPSCEGGFSSGTHLHIARRYNGRWLAADGSLPFVMDGWVSQGEGIEYNGFLVRGNEVKEACACAEDGNEIIR